MPLDEQKLWACRRASCACVRLRACLFVRVRVCAFVVERRCDEPTLWTCRPSLAQPSLGLSQPLPSPP